MQRIVLNTAEEALIIALSDMTRSRRVIVVAQNNRHAGYLHGMAQQLPLWQSLASNARVVRGAGMLGFEYLSPVGLPGVVHFVSGAPLRALRGRSADTVALIELRDRKARPLLEDVHLILMTSDDPRILNVPIDAAEAVQP